jgi:pimeloyl-ACP methyl ester carboxylesterase
MAETDTIEDEPAETVDRPAFRDIFFTSTDGLRLHARDYGPLGARSVPVLCLPGLTRSARDFHDLAMHLGHEAQRRRRVVVAEYRGRGQSEHDDDIENYTPKREAMDALDLMAVAGLEHVVAIGTSRGGLVTMVMGALRPAVLKGFVFNDIGPRIEGIGLLRIAAQLARMPAPTDWAEAVSQLRAMYEEAFTGMSPPEWDAFARAIYRDEDGRPKPDFDPKLVKTLDTEAISSGLVPELWPQFAGLGLISGLVIRGEHSDILAAETVAEMQRRHRRLSAVTVPGRGHAPFLNEPVALRAIEGLLARIDAA